MYKEMSKRPVSTSSSTKATDHFSLKMELGDGGYGAVYKDGRIVAVKKLYHQHLRRVEQFVNAVEILARLRHKNLVTLYGCTSCHSPDLLLVYEYVPNGTVSDHLYGMRPPLSWDTRLSIRFGLSSRLGMAVNRIQDDGLRHLVDPGLGFGSDDRVRGMAELAFRCLQNGRDKRFWMFLRRYRGLIVKQLRSEQLFETFRC